MRRKHFSLLASASLCGVLIQSGLLPTGAHAQTLNGQVSSTEEGNILTEEEQWAKLKLAVDVANEMWGK